MAYTHYILDNKGYRDALNTKYLLLFQGDSGYANASQYYVYTYIV